MSDYQQLKEKFDQLLIVDGQYAKSKWRTHDGMELRRQVDNAYIPEFHNLDEKIWALRFSTELRPKCVACGNLTRLKKNKFNDTCSASCAKLNPATAEKTRLTMQKKYGVDFPTQSKEVRKKIEQAYMDKFGVRVSSMAPEVTKKRKATNIEKYGIANVLMLPEIRKKSLINAASEESCEKRGTSLRKTYANFGDDLTEKRWKKYSELSLPSLLEEIAQRDKVIPLEEINWQGRKNDYRWKHLTCGREFTSRLHGNMFYACTYCKPRSIPQTKIKAILDDLGIQYKENDRTQITPYEIDLWIPSHNLGIEVNGAYWHHDETSALPLQSKTNLVEETNAQLLHFWDFEIEEKLPIIESIIKSKLGLLDRKIPARKCTLVEVTAAEAKMFFEANHLSGYAVAKFAFGLVFQNELVALGSFSKNRFSKEEANELVRFAVLKNVHVQGGLSKIIKAYKKQDDRLLISFADRRISTGKGYKSIGFTQASVTSPNYFYKRNNERISRQKAMKHKLPDLLGEKFNIEKTELENMTQNGWIKCSDAGNYKFVL